MKDNFEVTPIDNDVRNEQIQETTEIVTRLIEDPNGDGFSIVESQKDKEEQDFTDEVVESASNNNNNNDRETRIFDGSLEVESFVNPNDKDISREDGQQVSVSNIEKFFFLDVAKPGNDYNSLELVRQILDEDKNNQNRYCSADSPKRDFTEVVFQSVHGIENHQIEIYQRERALSDPESEGETKNEGRGINYDNQTIAKAIIQTLCRQEHSHALSVSDPKKVIYYNNELIGNIKTLKGVRLNFTFGKTRVAFDAEKLIENYVGNFAKGVLAIFYLFQQLDQAKLKPTLSEQLKEFGVVNLQTDQSYQSIKNEDIVLLSDNIQSVVIFHNAGFDAIDYSDGLCSEETKENLIISMPEIKLKIFSNESGKYQQYDYNQYKFSEVDAMRLSVIEELKKALATDDEKAKITLINSIQLAKLKPLFNTSYRGPFKWWVSPIGNDKRYYSVIDEISAAYIKQGFYHKELSEFLVETLCGRWQNSQIKTTIAKIIERAPEEEKTAVYFRLAYMAQYSNELLFKNPNSAMKKQIETNKDFDDKAISEISDNAKPGTRTEKVLNDLSLKK